jgi:1-acyl-sn-glycerol-3-phosphate acyltransferase
MRILKIILRALFSIYALLTFIMLMIPVFIWSLAVLPFGKIRGGNLLWLACRTWGDIWYVLLFIRHKNIYEQPLRKGASYIFVSNHISYFDIPQIVTSFRLPIRPLAKAEISKVPIFGLIYRNTVVSVDRSSPGNRAKSVQVMKSIIRKGVSVLVFPEGTFNTTHKPLKEFYDGAFRIAIETGTPIKPVLMLDTYDRLHYDSLFSLTPGKSRTIFLDEISTEGLDVKNVPALKAEVYAIMERKLLEYNATWIREVGRSQK